MSKSKQNQPPPLQNKTRKPVFHHCPNSLDIRKDAVEIDIDAANMSMNVNLVISSPCSEGIAFTILIC